jgi:hypothetical protein
MAKWRGTFRFLEVGGGTPTSPVRQEIAIYVYTAVNPPPGSPGHMIGDLFSFWCFFAE